MKNNKKSLIILLSILFLIIVTVGIGTVKKFNKIIENTKVTEDASLQYEKGIEENVIKSEGTDLPKRPAITTNDLELKNVTVRYKEEISEIYHGEKSGGYFYYINDILVYEKSGEDQAFLSVTDDSEIVNYGKKVDFQRKGMTVLAKTINPKGQFCQLEQDTDAKIYFVEYGEEEIKETVLRVEDKTLEADFSSCVLFVDSKAVYLRAYNPDWKNTEEEMKKTFLFFSKNGELIYEDNGMDMEPKEDGLMVILRRRPVAGNYVDFVEVENDKAVVKERRDFATGSNGRYFCSDRSTGQWYSIEDDRIEKFDIENIIPSDLERVLNYGTDTSFQLMGESTTGDLYDNEMEIFDGQVNDNGLINLMMGKAEGEGFIYQLYQYRRYENTRTDSTLKITVPYPVPLIKQAVTLYEKKYPESYVEIESAYDTYEDFKTYLDTYGEQMTTRIMTGDFGDIICSSHGVYQEQLLWSDAYLDLGGWVRTIESFENLNRGALKGLTVNGALRALPVGVNLYYYGVNEKLAKEEGITDPENLTWGRLLDIVLQWQKEGKKEKALFGNGFFGKDQLEYMIINNIKDLVNISEESCDLNQEWFLELMRKWKAASEAGCIYSYGQAEEYRSRNGEDTRFMSGFEKGTLLQAYSRRGLEFDWMDVDPVSEAEQYWRYNATHDCPQKLIGGINGEKSRNFNSLASMMFSVNARTEHKEEALRFMEFLMSERVQRLDSIPGIPMNLEADRKNWEKAARSVTEETEYLTSEKVMEYYEQFSSVYEDIDQLYSDYYHVYILRPMMSYISGTMTLEEAIDKAEKDLWLHLNE